MRTDRERHKERGSARAPAGARAPNDAAADPTYIVAIGGSAGGLEAFERFFANVPANTGMAFVVIQHLDPTHKALMPELLQRSTEMPVREIEDGMKVEADSIYVIPPDTDLSISDRRLHLSKPSAAHGQRLPIDLFFRSLAAEQGDRSIAVIVSGMGADGTLGLKAIKEVSGLVLVESPESAKFDGMPRSAISTGLADRVAPIDDLPGELIACVSHVPRARGEISERADGPPGALQRILRLLTTRTGHDFSLYKKSTLYRRIEKRASIHQIDKISEYARYVEQNPEEMAALFRELLIGVTRFFRDPGAFDYLGSKVIPDLVQNIQQGGSIRVWVPGCSTGEEAYSLAIVLRESVDKLRPNSGIKIQIFATDIDEQAIEVARKGLYPTSIEADVSPARLRAFFTQTETGYTVRKLIRETVVLAPHDVTADPPFTKMDMVSCRNLLIYFSPELQRRVLPIFHYALNPNGILFLGTAEGIGSFDELFSAVDTKWKVFTRKETSATRARLMGIQFRPPSVESPRFESLEREAGVDLAEALRRMLLERYAPPSVVVTVDGDIVLVSGGTGKYLELAEGTAALNAGAMAREGLRAELMGAIHRAGAQKATVTLKGLNVKTNGDYQRVDVTVSPLLQPCGAGELFAVTFEDVASPDAVDAGEGPSGRPDARCAALENELTYTKERLQATLEEMESASEELRAANEELQSTNEELQSTNEELTTSKEELESLNEELVTLNTELQSKVDDLTALNNDIVNLLNSTQIATIFLDKDLLIRRFTPAVVGMFNLRAMDTGRPITDITQTLSYETIERDARNVLATLAMHERQVESKDGRWYIMRIMPYRTLDDVIDGVVVTFADFTEIKRLEASLSRSESLSRALNDTNANIASTHDYELALCAAVTRAAEVLGVESGAIATRRDGDWVIEHVAGPQRLPSDLRLTDADAPYLISVVQAARPLAIGDTSTNGKLGDKLSEAYGTGTLLGIPLIAGGEPMGVLLLSSASQPVDLTAAELDFACKLGAAISLMLNNRRLYEAEQQAHQRLRQQHDLLQQALIPAHPQTGPGYTVASRFIAGAAGEQVGGDFFDVFRTEDGELAIVIGDVAGKGADAASLATATRSTIRAFAYDQIAPGQALTHTNAVIFGQDLDPERFVTVFLAVLDEENGKLRYSGGGHPPAMIRRAGGSVEQLEMAQYPIGLVGNAQYQEGEAWLEPGDKLLMYTDGISESHSDALVYDVEGIEATLREQGGLTPDETLEAVFVAATEAGGGRLSDDAAAVIIERDGAPDGGYE